MHAFPCPACGADPMTEFYAAHAVPVHSVLLLPTRDEAVSYRRGDIRLGYCTECGFVANMAFEPGVHEYAARYEATQGYSPTFSAFQEKLVSDLVERHSLYNRHIIEIGCGQGEFLTRLCQAGNNQGVGFDPAYAPERSAAPPDARVRFVQDFFSSNYAGLPADFICCRMTLEHIAPVYAFVHQVRAFIDEGRPCLVFFQVPNARYVIREAAFWDVYYEHCSYFDAGALGRLFRRAGFEVLNVWTGYDDQYLMIEARPASGEAPRHPSEAVDVQAWISELDCFGEAATARVTAWRAYLRALAAAGRQAVVWGGGSKAVAFLTTLGVTGAIEYAVDINPNKAGTFIAGTGQEIIGPSRLAAYGPDIVIVMNPVYAGEIRRVLGELGLSPQLLSVHGPEVAL